MHHKLHTAPGAIAAVGIGWACALLWLGCEVAPRVVATPKADAGRVVVRESFESGLALRDHWLADSPEASGTMVSCTAGALQIALSANRVVHVSRLVEPVQIAGHTLRLSARVKTSSPKVTAQLGISFGDSASDFTQRGWTKPSAPNAWTRIELELDVGTDTRRAELVLKGQGDGVVWFDDVEILDLGRHVEPALAELSPVQLEHLEALSRAVALIRYRHPSDGVAELDWNAFLVQAVARVLSARDRNELVEQLRALFSPVAPTVAFSGRRDHPISSPLHQGFPHLARWRHVGLGPEWPFASWREGRDPDQAMLGMDVLLSGIDLGHCKNATLTATGRARGEGSLVVVATVGQAGEAVKRVEGKLDEVGTPVSVELEMPADAFNVRLGLKARGVVHGTLSSLALSCEHRGRVAVDFLRAEWTKRGIPELYQVDVARCDAGACLAVDRRPFDAELVPDRDTLHAEIADHLWIHVPLALWSDGRQTWPVVAGRPAVTAASTPGVAANLALVSSAWGTLWTFYPFFSEQQIDWRSVLPGALRESAKARSVGDIYRALSRMIARTRDNHGRAFHPTVAIDGILPIALRRFGNHVVVVGAVEHVEKLVPLGSEVLSIDGEEIVSAYDNMRARVPAATVGWSDAIVPFWLTLGRIGAFATVRVRSRDGVVTEVALPHVSRAVYDALVREPRPASGTEVAPHVCYVDLSALSLDQWRALVPAVMRAKSLVLDMRGYPDNAAFTILGHFLKDEITSPLWRTPRIGLPGDQLSSWTIRPVAPRFGGAVYILLDGRAGSAAESVLQIARENHLGVLVGEPSGGTNGNVITVDLGQDFSMRFTGMRVVLSDGTLLQGRGITPDQVVHPTLEGVLAGRDEVLEAAIVAASKVGAK